MSQNRATSEVWNYGSDTPNEYAPHGITISTAGSIAAEEDSLLGVSFVLELEKLAEQKSASVEETEE